MKRASEAMFMRKKEGGTINCEPKKPRIGGEAGWLMRLPPNIFNGIVGLLDSRALQQLAKSHDQLQKMVRESEKHWKDVFVSGHTFCIDYECYEKLDAELLLDNAKIDNYKADEPDIMLDSRGLAQLPTELVELILGPLEFRTLFQVEGCHEKLKTIGRRIPVGSVCHRTNNFNVSNGGLEPIWEIENPVVRPLMKLFSGRCSMDLLARLGWKFRDATDKVFHEIDEAVLPDDDDMSNSLLDGRHVTTVYYVGADHDLHRYIGQSPVQSKVKPKFTCDNFFYPYQQEDRYLDKEILQALKPKNVWAPGMTEWMFQPDFPKGSLTFGFLHQDEFGKVVELQASRLLFKASFAGTRIIGLLSVFIDEWMAGRRNIETIGILPYDNDDSYDSDSYEDQEAEEAVELDANGEPKILMNLMETYPSLRLGERYHACGVLKRVDGKMLEVRVGFRFVALTAPGLFPQNRDELYRDAPES